MIGGFVFSKRCYNRKAYKKAVQAVGLGDFNFHDLMHCAINNFRLAGNDHFVIKQASGAKTDSAFKRYNLATEEEMKGMKWLEEKEENCGTMDTYMDTKA
jgi:integrase